MDVSGILSRDEQMTAKLAVLIYDGGGDTVATVNPVLKDPQTGAPLIHPGDCLSRENLESLSAALTGGTRERMILPENVLLSEMGIIAWWTPPAHRPVFFETGTGFDKEANAKMALHPALVFIGKPRMLTVYALAAARRPGPCTVMMRAPYYNLEGHGIMCRGNVPVPDVATPANIPDYERAFFDSSFVHTNLGTLDMTSHPRGHNGLWREMIASSHGVYPSHWLIPVMQAGEPMTLQKAINLK